MLEIRFSRILPSFPFTLEQKCDSAASSDSHRMMMVFDVLLHWHSRTPWPTSRGSGGGFLTQGSSSRSSPLTYCWMMPVKWVVNACYMSAPPPPQPAPTALTSLLKANSSRFLL